MSKAQDDLDFLGDLCERMGLDDTEKDSFIGSAMKRLGHRPKMLWEDGDGDGNEGGGDFFSSIGGKGKNRETRATRPGRRSGSSGWQYGQSA